MFARVHVLETTPEQHAEGLELVREQVLPWLRETSGFRGLIGLVSRERGDAMVISLWADKASLDATAAASEKLTALTAETSGAVRRSLADYEITHFEVANA